MSKWFGPNNEQFACKCGCGLCNPDPQLVLDLDEFRDEWGLPVIITSGSRCAKHCLDIGDEIPSFRNVHQPAPSDGYTKAVDIACESARMRMKLIEFFKCKKGYRRIEVTNLHVHVDRGVDNVAQDVFIVNWIVEHK